MSSQIPMVLLGGTSARTLRGFGGEERDPLSGSPCGSGPSGEDTRELGPFETSAASLKVWAPLGPLPSVGSYLIALERRSHQDDGPHGRHHVIGGHMLCLEGRQGGETPEWR